VTSRFSPSFASALVQAGLLPAATADEAERRRRMYGGGLDTVLLEMGALDERTLITHLANHTGIAAVPLERLAGLEPQAVSWLDAGAAARLGAVPIGRHEDGLELALHPEANHDALVAWASERQVLIEPFLVVEARFRGLLGIAYQIPVPPRFMSLLARLMGASAARRWQSRTQPPRTPPPQPLSPTAVDEVGALLENARLGDEGTRSQAWRALRRRLRDPRVAAASSGLQAKLAGNQEALVMGALRALSDLHDPSSVPAIVECLESSHDQIALAARAALLAITCEDLGPRRRRWLDWWEKMQHRPRMEWLLEALGHRDPQIRLTASQELQEITGEYFGYHYDLPDRDREEARRRWWDWWRTSGKLKFSL
jgi:hypothetical protein